MPLDAILFSFSAIWQVVYKEKDSDSGARFWMVEGNVTHSVQLTGLGKYVLYEIQVLAFTRVGDGRPSSPAIFQRTLDDGRRFGLLEFKAKVFCSILQTELLCVYHGALQD